MTSLDSSKEWLERVRAECLAHDLSTKPKLTHVDIGETGDWGVPVENAKKDLWPDYHTTIWSDPEAGRADLYLVDGRFRVACFMQTVLHAQSGALIAIHDFANRPYYHVVRDVAREVAALGSFSVFARKPDYDPAHASAVLKDHAFDPA